MEVKLAIPIILLALLLGSALSLADADKISGDWLQDEPHDQTSPSPNGQSGEDDEVHEHGLMYVTMNNTTLKFLEDRYQMADYDIHFENKVPHVVHKHKANVTWQDFLDTLNATVEHENGTKYCGEFKNHSYCGEGMVQLNGEQVTDLDKEIHQDDNLVIVLQPNYEKWVEKHEQQELPRIFKKQKITGRGV